MPTDLPRRSMRSKLVLDLPRVTLDAEGRVIPKDFEHYTRVLSEWARDVSDRQRDGLWLPELHAVTADPALGTGGSITGDWHLESGWVTLRFVFTFGSAGVGAGTGIYSIEHLPFRINQTDIGVGGMPVGQVHLRNVGIASRFWTIYTSGETALRMADPNGADVTDAVPWAWGAGDNLRGWARYKVGPNNT